MRGYNRLICKSLAKARQLPLLPLKLSLRSSRTALLRRHRAFHEIPFNRDGQLHRQPSESEGADGSCF
jgi:hypothetical protein